MSFESNLGANRYVYRLTATADYPPTSHAIPVASVVPPNAVEVGIVSVAVEYSTWGYEGMRSSRGEFYDELSLAAQRLGGTHFHVHDSEGAEFITGMTVSVLRVPEEQAAPAAEGDAAVGPADPAAPVEE